MKQYSLKRKFVQADEESQHADAVAQSGTTDADAADATKSPQNQASTENVDRIAKVEDQSA